MATRKEVLEELKSKLERAEAKEVPGAPQMEPKGQMLDATEYEARHDDKYIRWCNTTNKEKMEQRRLDGFQPVSEEAAKEAGVSAQLGEMRLMEQSRERHEARVKRQEQVNADRLKQHNRDVEAAAEAVAKQLRDRHGINVDTDRLLVRE